MNKKIIIFSATAVFILLAISFASAIKTNDDQKDALRQGYSPLFLVRIKKAIKDKLQDFKSCFIGERVFYLPFQWLINRENIPLRNRFVKITDDDYTFCDTFCPKQC